MPASSKIPPEHDEPLGEVVQALLGIGDEHAGVLSWRGLRSVGVAARATHRTIADAPHSSGGRTGRDRHQAAATQSAASSGTSQGARE